MPLAGWRFPYRHTERHESLICVDRIFELSEGSGEHLVVGIPEHDIRSVHARQRQISRFTQAETRGCSNQHSSRDGWDRHRRSVVDYDQVKLPLLPDEALHGLREHICVLVPDWYYNGRLCLGVSLHRLAVSTTVMSDSESLTITRIIARLNIGGPAIQAISLTHLLDSRGYRTHLVRGTEAPSEGNMDHLAHKLGVEPTLVPQMKRDPGPQDAEALLSLVRILREDRPDIVHTHAAKAGTLGRLAAVLAFPRPARRPVLVHTYHGHSLTGYFSGRTATFYRQVERALAKVTDRLVAVSPEVRDDLVALRVAAPVKFTVIPLGFNLSRFVHDSSRSERRAALRAEWGVEPDAELVTLVARLVPIKRVDRFLRIARRLATRPKIRFAVVGGGELQEQLRCSDDALALGDRVIWSGFRRDIPDVCFASDVVVLTSDNEGTPVSLIEAQAAATPVVGTDVGGVRSAVREGVTGFVVAAGDEAGFAAKVTDLLDHAGLRSKLAAAARAHATSAYSDARLVADHDLMYRHLLRTRPQNFSHKARQDSVK